MASYTGNMVAFPLLQLYDDLLLFLARYMLAKEQHDALRMFASLNTRCLRYAVEADAPLRHNIDIMVSLCRELPLRPEPIQPTTRMRCGWVPNGGYSTVWLSGTHRKKAVQQMEDIPSMRARQPGIRAAQRNVWLKPEALPLVTKACVPSYNGDGLPADGSWLPLQVDQLPGLRHVVVAHNRWEEEVPIVPASARPTSSETGRALHMHALPLNTIEPWRDAASVFSQLRHLAFFRVDFHDKTLPGDLPHLEVLDLTHCTGLQQRPWIPSQGAASVTVLRLCYTDATRVPPGFLGLQKLYMTGCRLFPDWVPQDGLARLTTVCLRGVVQLDEDFCTDDDPRLRLPASPVLTVLDLSQIVHGVRVTVPDTVQVMDMVESKLAFERPAFERDTASLPPLPHLRRLNVSKDLPWLSAWATQHAACVVTTE